MLGTVRPVRADGLDPHAVISFTPEADQQRGLQLASQRSNQAQDLAVFVFEDEGFDCRVGDKRRRDAIAAAEKSAAEARQAVKAAEDGGRAAAAAAKKGRPSGKVSKEQAAKPVGPLPKGWRCVAKVHGSGQREGQKYKVYFSPAGKSYLSYASAQAEFVPKAPPSKPPPQQVPQQPRRAEYLPPDWAVVRNRDGSRTYLGPLGERHSSWSALVEDLAGRGVASQLPAAAGATSQARPDDASVPAAAGSAAEPGDSAAGARETAAWLWRLGREVQLGHCELQGLELLQAQRVLRLRLARLRHD